MAFACDALFISLSQNIARQLDFFDFWFSDWLLGTFLVFHFQYFGTF